MTKLTREGKMNVLDLFSGIGGFSLGLHNAGNFKTTQFVEIDKFCQKVLAKNFPNIPIHDDIKTFKGKLNQFDIICGGFPCQDISVAGKKKGITNETRSGLWYEYKRIIKEVNPRYVIIENVRNLLNNGLAIVLKDLHEIGYDAEWEVISARSVGACHLRERLWIVAYPNCTMLESERPKLKTTRTKGRANEKIAREFYATFPDIGRRKAQEIRSQVQASSSALYFASSNNFRFWPTFTSEEEKSEWWSEATSSICDWWQTESSICRVDDGLSKELDKDRVNRIKALGNSIVPQIAEIIGNRIMYHEEKKEQNE